DDIDGGRLTAEDPQPSVLAANAPARFIGMDYVALSQGFQQQVVGRLGQVGQALFRADEGSRAHFQLAVGLQKIGDAAITGGQPVKEAKVTASFSGNAMAPQGADGVFVATKRPTALALSICWKIMSTLCSLGKPDCLSEGCSIGSKTGIETPWRVVASRARSS